MPTFTADIEAGDYVDVCACVVQCNFESGSRLCLWDGTGDHDVTQPAIPEFLGGYVLAHF